MILVRNQITDMLGGEKDKITFGKFSINLGLRAKIIPVCVQNIDGRGMWRVWGRGEVCTGFW